MFQTSSHSAWNDSEWTVIRKALILIQFIRNDTCYWPLTFEFDWSQHHSIGVVGAVKGSLATEAATLAAARVVIVIGADDHLALQVHIGVSPEELESLESELSVVVMTTGVGII